MSVSGNWSLELGGPSGVFYAHLDFAVQAADDAAGFVAFLVLILHKVWVQHGLQILWNGDHLARFWEINSIRMQLSQCKASRILHSLSYR